MFRSDLGMRHMALFRGRGLESDGFRLTMWEKFSVMGEAKMAKMAVTIFS